MPDNREPGRPRINALLLALPGREFTKVDPEDYKKDL
jgi:hypothetical protein